MQHEAEPPAFSDAEIVLGLTAPVGTDFTLFTDSLEVALRDFRYRANVIHLGQLAQRMRSDSTVSPSASGTAEYRRLTELMNAGNEARRADGEILALAAAARVLSGRATDANGHRAPRGRTAHILRSLKHPGEVHALR